MLYWACIYVYQWRNRGFWRFIKLAFFLLFYFPFIYFLYIFASINTIYHVENKVVFGCCPFVIEREMTNFNLKKYNTNLYQLCPRNSSFHVWCYCSQYPFWHRSPFSLISRSILKIKKFPLELRRKGLCWSLVHVQRNYTHQSILFQMAFLV